MQGDRQKVNRRYKCDNGDSCWDEDPINCEKTCNPQCTQNNGCNLSLPPNNPDFDKTKPVSQCKTLPAKSIKLTTAKWCASSTWARENCQTTCNIRQTCRPLCVDKDPNCPKIAAKKGCYGLYN